MSAPAPPPWLAAVEQLDALHRGVEAVALLRAAQRTGLLAALPCAEQELAAQLGVRAERVAAALGVLAAHGIVVRTGDEWALDAGWAPLVLGRTPLRFEALLGLSRVRAQQFERALTGGEDYWQLEAGDRMVVAHGISPDPVVAAALPAFTDLSRLEGATEALQGGGRLLELGCGIASRLCAMLRAYPQALGVGVELDPDLVEAARAQAAQTGVDDRLELVCGDVTGYRAEQPFDLVQWSQFFFPGPTREAALQVAWASLRPGGWLRMPALWDGTAYEPGSPRARALAGDRLLMDLWQVPLRSGPELAAEVEAAGFTEVQVDVAPVMCTVLGRRPA